jgi:hypothetical protein
MNPKRLPSIVSLGFVVVLIPDDTGLMSGQEPSAFGAVLVITDVNSSTKLPSQKSIGRIVSNYIMKRRMNNDKDHSIAQISARNGSLRAG